MDRQVLLAVALSALVVIAYQEYLRIYYPDLGKKQAPAGRRDAGAVARPSAAAPPHSVQEECGTAPSGDVAVDTPLVHAAFSSLGGRLVSLKLKRYRTTIDPQSPPLELIAAGASQRSAARGRAARRRLLERSEALVHVERVFARRSRRVRTERWFFAARAPKG